MIVDGDQGDANICNMLKPYVYCEVRRVWTPFSVSLNSIAVELVGNARESTSEMGR